MNQEIIDKVQELTDYIYEEWELSGEGTKQERLLNGLLLDLNTFIDLSKECK